MHTWPDHLGTKKFDRIKRGFERTNRKIGRSAYFVGGLAVYEGLDIIC